MVRTDVRRAPHGPLVEMASLLLLPLFPFETLQFRFDWDCTKATQGEGPRARSHGVSAPFPSLLPLCESGRTSVDGWERLPTFPP